jgi:hypothetical protein
MSDDAPTLVARILAIAAALDAAAVPWAVGGALALAYATEEPRATRDIDVNVFVPATEAAGIYDALPDGVRHDDDDIDAARRDDQVRLWWDDTPVDVFFAADAFHDEVATRCRRVAFAGATIAILAAEDLAVFKALFDRPKDWVDIATMAESRALDVERAADRLAALLGNDDRVQRLRSIP